MEKYLIKLLENQEESIKLLKKLIKESDKTKSKKKIVIKKSQKPYTHNFGGCGARGGCG